VKTRVKTFGRATQADDTPRAARNVQATAWSGGTPSLTIIRYRQRRPNATVRAVSTATASSPPKPSANRNRAEPRNPQGVHGSDWVLAPNGSE
jgi:hypothetical protein